MDWMQSAVEAGAVTISAMTIMIVAIMFYRKSGDTPSLTSAIESLSSSITDIVKDGAEERTAYQEANKLIVAELKTIGETIATAFAQIHTDKTENKDALNILTDKIGTLETVMTDHTNAEPSNADLIRAIEELGRKIDRVDRNVGEITTTVGQIKEEFSALKTQAETIQERETRERPAIPPGATHPPPIQPDVKAVSKTAAQRAVEQVKNEVKQADTPPERKSDEST